MFAKCNDAQMNRALLYHGMVCRNRLLLSAFTIVELITTLLVFSIIIAVGIPSFTTMAMNARIAAANDELVNALNYARSTALSQGITVQVCPIGTVGSAACGGNWGSGWSIIALPTGSPANLLKSKQYTVSDPTLTSTAGVVSFDTHGLATSQSNFKICDSRGGTFARSVMVLATGYVQSSSTPGQAVWDNSNLACP